MVMISSMLWDLARVLENLVNAKWKFQFGNLFFWPELARQFLYTDFEPSLRAGFFFEIEM